MTKTKAAEQTKHTVRMLGHGVDFTIPGFSGLPTYCTAPREIQRAIEAAYRSVIGDSTGGLSWHTHKSRTRKLSEGVFETSQAVELSLYKVMGDKVSRRDDSTRRAFRLYSRYDYR